MDFDARFPCFYLWVNGIFGTIWENGDVEFYADNADIRIPLATMKTFVQAAGRFMYAREQVKNAS